MKVLLVQKMAGISGSERYFLNILPALRKRGLDVAFLVVQHPANAAKNREFMEELDKAAVPVHIYNTRFPLSPLLIWRLARLLRLHRFDILQTNLIHADVWGTCVKRFFLPRLRMVSVKHGYSDLYQARYGLDPAHLKMDVLSFLTRWTAKSSDTVICISSALESFLVKGGLVEQNKTTTIPYGFDFSGASRETASGQLRFGNPQIIVAGRLVRVKQHHLLLRILPALVQDFPSLAVVMVGSGPLMDELVQETKRLGLTKHVRWEGFRSNMHDYIHDSDLMVVPSAAEGFGLVVLEAWYHSKPVIAFDVPALNEIINPGTDGELVKPFDTRQLHASLKKLLSDPKQMNLMGVRGRDKQREVYGISAMCDRTITVYQELLA